MRRRLREIAQLACFIVASTQGAGAEAEELAVLETPSKDAAQSGPRLPDGEHVSAYAHLLLLSGHRILSTTHLVESEGRVYEVNLEVDEGATVSKVQVAPESPHGQAGALRPPAAPGNLLLQKN